MVVRCSHLERHSGGLKKTRYDGPVFEYPVKPEFLVALSEWQRDQKTLAKRSASARRLRR